MKTQTENIEACYLEVVLMPQGELIHQGKTVGWLKDCKKYLYNKNIIDKKVNSHDALVEALKGIILDYEATIKATLKTNIVISLGQFRRIETAKQALSQAEGK